MRSYESFRMLVAELQGIALRLSAAFPDMHAEFRGQLLAIGEALR